MISEFRFESVLENAKIGHFSKISAPFDICSLVANLPNYSIRSPNIRIWVSSEQPAEWLFWLRTSGRLREAALFNLKVSRDSLRLRVLAVWESILETKWLTSGPEVLRFGSPWVSHQIGSRKRLSGWNSPWMSTHLSTVYSTSAFGKRSVNNVCQAIWVR